MKNLSIIFIVLLVFTGETCADKDKIMYDQSLARWNKEAPGSYYIKVNYRAFSPQQGLWELEVKEGQVVRASFKGAWDEKFIKPAERFTVASIFKTAEAVRSGKADGPMIVNTEFSETIPFIKSVSRVNNEQFKGAPVKDAGYSIIILEFERR